MVVLEILGAVEAAVVVVSCLSGCMTRRDHSLGREKGETLRFLVEESMPPSNTISMCEHPAPISSRRYIVGRACSMHSINKLAVF